MKKTLCELFAGVGGFRVGLENTSDDWKTVWANQWEPGKKSQYAFDCYQEHFGKKNIYVNEDIGKIDKNKIPNHTLLVGGFPCQDYSVAHTGAKGISGKKGVLWWDIYDTLEAKKPPFVLLENVDRLLKSPSSQRGRDFGIILACFNELGYNVEWRVINAADYGFAQRRRRIFIFAYNEDTKYYKEKNKIDSIDLIHKDGFFIQQFKIEEGTYGKEYPFTFENIANVSDNFKLDFKNSGVMKKNTIYTEEIVPIKENPTTLRELAEGNVACKYYIKDNIEKWNYLKGSKDILRTSSTGYSYHFREGKVAFPDSLDLPARTMLTSESSLNRSTHIISDPITNKLRILTPLETERINGFPDNWTNTGMPESFRYFCMGNALVVGLIEKMGKTLNKIIESED